MFRKFFLAAVTLVAFSAASFAAEFVMLDLNYYCRGQLKLLSKLPEGVTMSARKNYSQKKFAKLCLYTLRIDVSKVQELEFEIEVVDTEGKESAKLNPSLSPQKGLAVECLEFEAGGEPSSKVPCKITRWTGMQSLMVAEGEKIAFKLKLKKAAAKK